MEYPLPASASQFWPSLSQQARYVSAAVLKAQEVANEAFKLIQYSDLRSSRIGMDRVRLRWLYKSFSRLERILKTQFMLLTNALKGDVQTKLRLRLPTAYSVVNKQYERPASVPLLILRLSPYALHSHSRTFILLTSWFA